MLRWAFSIVFFVFILGCQSSTTVKKTQKSAADNFGKVDVPGSGPLPVPPPSAQWTWAYSGSKGPDAWGGLMPEFSTCQSGQAQSPVDLIWKAPKLRNKLKLNYQEGRITLTNTGYAYRLNFEPQSTIEYDGKEYALEKAELRMPSEHTLSGKQVHGELQLYHRTTNGLRRAMVSLMIVRGKSSEWFQSFIDVAKTTAPYATNEVKRMNPQLLIPPTKTFYHYEGSLTHPPCVEGVQWFVFNTPIELSREQLLTLKKAYPQNNRPTQPLNGRSVVNHK